MRGQRLIRKLTDEGTSFKLPRGTLLRQRAERAPRRPPGGRPGLSDKRLRQAFKRWTGVTPARFRARAAARLSN